MKIAVSACLLGVECRYDGKAKPSHAVQRFLHENGYEAVPVCPEAAAGLPVPHPPCEIMRAHTATAPENARTAGAGEHGRNGTADEGVAQPDMRTRVVDCTGTDRTAAFQEGARKELERVTAHQCKAAVLKSKSPSCGLGRVYDGTFTGTLVPGDGVFTQLLASAGVPCCTEEDIARGGDPFN